MVGITITLATRIVFFCGKIEVHPLLPFDPVTDPKSIGKYENETYLVAVNVTDD